jgi:hypothetical protein
MTIDRRDPIDFAAINAACLARAAALLPMWLDDHIRGRDGGEEGGPFATGRARGCDLAGSR